MYYIQCTPYIVYWLIVYEIIYGIQYTLYTVYNFVFYQTEYILAYNIRNRVLYTIHGIQQCSIAYNNCNYNVMVRRLYSLKITCVYVYIVVVQQYTVHVYIVVVQQSHCTCVYSRLCQPMITTVVCDGELCVSSSVQPAVMSHGRRSVM